MLRKKSKKACLTEAALMRFLLKGYEPREKPGDDFYTAMNKVSQFAEEIEKMSGRISNDSESNIKMLQAEIKRWHSFQADIEKQFLLPDEHKELWQ